MSDNTLLLQQLMDIKQPATSFAWPPAPGWWIVMVFLLFIITTVFFYWFKNTQIKREALSELLILEQNYNSNHNLTQLSMNVSILLRRVALAKFLPEQVAGLTGQQWLEFLDAHGETKDFTQGAGIVLLDVPYQQSNNPKHEKKTSVQGLIQLARSWIRNNA